MTANRRGELAEELTAAAATNQRTPLASSGEGGRRRLSRRTHLAGIRNVLWDCACGCGHRHRRAPVTEEEVAAERNCATYERKQQLTLGSPEDGALSGRHRFLEKRHERAVVVCGVVLDGGRCPVVVVRVQGHGVGSGQMHRQCWERCGG